MVFWNPGSVMPVNKDLIAKATKCLAVNDIYLRDSNIRMSESFNPKAPEHGSYDIQFRHGPKNGQIAAITKDKGDEIRIFLVTYECAFRLVPPGLIDNKDVDEKKILENICSEVTASFIAEYIIKCDDYDPVAFDEFSKHNVGYHVWPYWREYAQSTASRLRLPQFAIPLYRIQQ